MTAEYRWLTAALLLGAVLLGLIVWRIHESSDRVCVLFAPQERTATPARCLAWAPVQR